jgi:aromatic ring-opening dioxygenase LigB subunit
MSGLVFACIAPHGGLVISEISGAEGRKAVATRRAMEELGRRMTAARPETIVLVTPHGLPVSGAFSLLDARRVGGELHGAGGTVAVSFQVDNALNAAIAATACQCDVPVARLMCGPAAQPTACLPLDWGAVVPFWFIGRALDPAPRVVVACPDRDLPLALFPRFGQLVRHAAEQVGRRIAFIASADLGHAHDPCGPYGYDPAAAEYDAATIEAIEAQDLGRMLAWDPAWLERAKTDALWQILNLHGAIAGQRFRGELLSYEVPTYFGMLCAAYESGRRADGQSGSALG